MRMCKKKYWEILKNSAWNNNKKEMPKYSILEIVLEDRIDFNDKDNMIQNIIQQSVSLALEIQEHLQNIDC